MARNLVLLSIWVGKFHFLHRPCTKCELQSADITDTVKKTHLCSA